MVAISLLAVFVAMCSGFAVVGYLPEWRFDAYDWDRGCALHTHLIVFSVEPSAFGDVVGIDRIPSAEVMEAARRARSAGGCKLMLCFGGNGRSGGFAAMTTRPKRRATFIQNMKQFLDRHGFDGVDYNWEYPGFAFGHGYKSDQEVRSEFAGLRDLVQESRVALGKDRPITIAYYPDGRQERIIKDLEIPAHVDLMHAMTYDQGGEHHSSFEWASRAILSSIQVLPPSKVTFGLPFYGRKVGSGDWITYEDLCQKHELDPMADVVTHENSLVGFNGIVTIEKKVTLAISRGLGGVMIWESGQDCRVNPVQRGGKIHVTTCPRGEDSSLLRAIIRAIHKHHKEL